MNKEIIINRHSTRTFKKEALQIEHLNTINAFITNLNIPLDINIKILTNINIKEKIGTYGFISNPAAYLIAYCKNKPMILETIGYYLENIVLYATSLGIGTCFLGATFSKKQIKKILNISDDMIIPIIIVLGYPLEKLTIKDKIIKSSINSTSRLPFNKLFFGENLKTLNYDINNKYHECLEMVRLAPSAFNLQPWRIIETNNAYHVYIYHNSPLDDNDIKHIDMGIAIAHFILMCKELNLKGHLEIIQDHINYPNFNYIISWLINNDRDNYEIQL